MELFHALSDGTGALWFFEDLLKAYIMLRHPEAFEGLDAAAHDRLNHQLEDSFAHYFRKDKKQNFTDAAQSAIRSVAKVSQMTGKNYAQKSALPEENNLKRKRRVHQFRGKRRRTTGHMSSNSRCRSRTFLPWPGNNKLL